MQLTHGRTSFRFVTEPPHISSAWAAVVIVAALLAILKLDASTGATPVQHLYYLPIVFAGVTFRWRGGLACAIAAIVLYHLANPHPFTWRDEQPDGLQMAVFIAAGVLSAKLADDAQRLRRVALTDDLTGLHNLRSFEARLHAMVRGAQETGQPLSLLVLDLDRLKSLNDVYGHLAGAEAVRLVGRILAERLPSHAVACRYGGDEFVVALPGSDDAEAVTVAEAVGRCVHATAPILAGVAHPRGKLSISVGVAARTFEKTGSSSVESTDAAGEHLFRAADAALYAAKNSGRNRISVAPMHALAGLR
ncbi:MAG TPA: GGDEF domain-containing protein [Vicinamibacterales bacterium]|nr:GGDEF domain-containing protein [Vicinamibacterales bacterium]